MDVSPFENDILVTTTVDGQVITAQVISSTQWGKGWSVQIQEVDYDVAGREITPGEIRTIGASKLKAVEMQ